MGNAGARVHIASAETWYRSWVAIMFSRSWVWSSSRLVTNSRARLDTRSRLGVKREVWVVALVCKERGNSHGAARRVVVCKLGEGEEAQPVVLLVVAVDTEVLFQSLVSALGLSVTFQVVSRGEVQLHVQGGAKGPEELGHEFRPTVGSDMQRDTMLGEDVEDEKLHEVTGGNGVICWDE